MLRWIDNCIEYEADPRHVEIISKQLNISDCKSLKTPGPKEEGHAKPRDEIASRMEDRLDAERYGVYRAIVARANYIAPDMPDIAYAVQ